MTEETPKVDDLKEEERLKIDVDETVGGAKTEATDVTEEFKRLGRQFGETLESLFSGPDAKRMESEVREGVKQFAGEVEKFMREASQSPAATRLKSDAEDFRKRVDSGDVAKTAQSAFVQGLRWLSNELERVADNVGKADVAGTKAASKSDVEEIIVEKSPEE